jgi:hypothetical protein
MFRWQVLNLESFAFFVTYSVPKREKVAIATPFLVFLVKKSSSMPRDTTERSASCV